jgi:acetyl esterase/lipase
MQTRVEGSGGTGLVLLDAIVSRRGYVAHTDIAYGAGPRHRLDVYRPTGTAARAPVIVFLYGGAWETGARRWYRFVGQGFARAGCVTVVPDYRLYPEVRYPGFVEDAAAAAAWVAAHIAEFGGDPARVHLMGHSAGAHIALMLALNRVFLGPDVSVAGAIGLAGPYAFEPTGRTRAVLDSDGGGPSAMPVDYVDASAPRLLLMTGGADDTVSPGNSTRLAARVRERGGRADLVVYPRVGHSRLIAALATPLAWLVPVRRDVLHFVRAG